MVVVEFFDSGYSRRLPWTDRPEAAALLDAVADPNRSFDAIVGRGVRASVLRQPVARGNTLLTGVWKLSPKATGRLNDLYGQTEVISPTFR